MDLTAIVDKRTKELIHSYFLHFNNNEIPLKYSNFIKTIKYLKDLPSTFINTNNLLYIPKTQKNIEIIGTDFYLELILVPSNYQWNEQKIQIFEKKSQGIIKQKIGQLMNAVHLHFTYLKKNNMEELKTINFITDPENVTIKIQDLLFPDYEHPIRITWNIVLNTDN